VVPVGPLVGLLRATHPLPAAAVTLLVGGLAAVKAVPPGTLAWIVASTAAGQASVGWSNDYLDRERDAAAGRTEKPLVAGLVSPRGTLGAAVAAFALSVALSVPVGLLEAGVMFAGLGSAWAYNLWLKATVLSWLPYAVSFGLVPVYVWSAAGDTAPAWLVAGGALLGVAAHLVNVLPDLEADRIGSIRGVPHRLGPRATLALACVFLASVPVLALAFGGPMTVARAGAAGLVGGLVAGVAWAGARGRYRLAFLVAIAAAGSIVLLLALGRDALRA
jgi:4-hydroxybenzoate polyprenyltransferase